MKQRFSEEQILAILQEAEAATDRAAVFRQYAFSEWTFYRWRKRFQGLDLPQAKRLKQSGSCSRRRPARTRAAAAAPGVLRRRMVAEPRSSGPADSSSRSGIFRSICSPYGRCRQRSARTTARNSTRYATA